MTILIWTLANIDATAEAWMSRRDMHEGDNIEVNVNEMDVIRRAQLRDEEAWFMLVREHQAALFRLAYLLTGDVDEAKDVVQEVLIRAYQKLSRFDSTRPMRPWLLQIVRNLSYNHRRTSRRYIAAIRRWWQHWDASQTIPLDPSEQDSAQVMLWHTVRQLPRSDQEVIYLRYFLELSVMETADVLAIAEGTVKSRLSRALARLRAMIEQDDAWHNQSHDEEERQ